MLMVRRPEPFWAEPMCTILGGVCPRSGSGPWLLPKADGELLRSTLNCGARLGVSKFFGALAERTKRCASDPCSCLGGDDGSGRSFSSASVTLENLIAGGGSSSESLSLTSMCFAGALLEYPWE